MGIETADEGTEDIEEFRLRARSWLAANMPRLADGQSNAVLAREDESGEQARRLQRLLQDH